MLWSERHCHMPGALLAIANSQPHFTVVRAGDDATVSGRHEQSSTPPCLEDQPGNPASYRLTLALLMSGRGFDEVPLGSDRTARRTRSA